jgi:5-methylcytosine-specific restriction endonuclease McrA
MSHEKIFHRDGHICRYCGVALTKDNRSIDHITPKSKGGRNAPYNYAAACRTCNFLKGNKLVSPLLGIGEALRKVKKPPTPRKVKYKPIRKPRVHKPEINWAKVQEIKELYAELATMD